MSSLNQASTSSQLSELDALFYRLESTITAKIEVLLVDFKSEINGELVNIRQDLNDVRNEVSTLSSELKTVRNEVSTLSSELKTVRNEVSTLSSELKTVRNEVSTLSSQVKTMNVNFVRWQNDGFNEMIDTGLDMAIARGAALYLDSNREMKQMIEASACRCRGQSNISLANGTSSSVANTTSASEEDRQSESASSGKNTFGMH